MDTAMIQESVDDWEEKMDSVEWDDDAFGW